MHFKAMDYRVLLKKLSHSTSEEISCLMQNSKVHYRVHKIPLEFRGPVYHYARNYFLWWGVPNPSPNPPTRII